MLPLHLRRTRGPLIYGICLTSAPAWLPIYKVPSWFGLHVAKGTPRPIIDKLNIVLRKIQSWPILLRGLRCAARSTHAALPTPVEQDGLWVHPVALNGVLLGVSRTTRLTPRRRLAASA